MRPTFLLIMMLLLVSCAEQQSTFPDFDDDDIAG